MNTLPENGSGDKPVVRTAAEGYKAVNAAWPEGPLPKLTGTEAIRAAKRLWRHIMGKAWTGTWKAGRGNHRSYPRPGRVFLVNPGQGWHDLVHDLSHQAHRRLNPRQNPHAGGHERIEREMIRYVVAQGWLDGRLRPVEKPKPAKAPLIERRAARTKAALERARHRLKLAQAAVKRLEPQAKRYERDIAKKAAKAV